MLRRILVLTVLLLYVATTTGFALTVHFCGTRVSEVRLNSEEKKKCCTQEESGQPDRCCKDKHVKIKVSDQQQHHSSPGIPAVHSIDLFYHAAPATLLFNTVAAKKSSLTYRGPPVLQTIPLTIRYSVFRI